MKQLITTILIIINLSVFAQNKVQISGQIKDKTTHENLNFCSVVVISQTDSVITGAVTNDKGYFYIPVNRGSYKLILSFIGYLSDTINIGFIGSDKFLGIYKLEKNSEIIDEITVKSSSRESTIDKDIQIVTTEMRKNSTDAKEVLEKAPGVSYDRYNNSIKVDNNSNIIILVDGVEKDQEYIKNLPPERLKKFEIIRDPGGRYGLEGYSAIINVILNKNYVGHEVFFYNQLLIDADQPDMNHLFPLNNFRLSYNYTRNKLNIYGGINNEIKNFALTADSKTEYADNTTIYEQPPTENPNTFINEISTNYTIGADYYINPKHTVSFESNITNFPENTSNTDNDVKTYVIKDGIITNTYNFSLKNRKNLKSSYNSLFYVGKLSNKDNINANLTYYNYTDEYTNTTIQEDIYNRTETGTNDKDYTRFNVEYTRNFNSKLNTQIGYGNTWKSFDNTYNINYNNTTSTEYYSQTETRHKFYGYLSYTINKKFSTRVGLATETSNPSSDMQSHNYIIYQPLFDFKYKINKLISLKLKYRSNSDYPSMNQTNPFESKINPTTVSVGNPNLSPAVIHKISLRASVMQGLISVEPYYHFSNNYIGQTGTLRPDSIFEFTYNNVGFYEEKGVKTNFTIPFGKLFVWQNSFSFYSSKITYEGYDNSLSDWRADSKLIFIGMKKGGIFLLMYQRSMSKDITATGYARNQNDYWLLLAQQPFFKKQLNIMIGYMLPVDLGANFNQNTYINTNGYEKTQNVDISVLKNMVMFKLTYRFNKGKIKKTAKNIEIESEGNGNGGFF